MLCLALRTCPWQPAAMIRIIRWLLACLLLVAEFVGPPFLNAVEAIATQVLKKLRWQQLWLWLQAEQCTAIHYCNMNEDLYRVAVWGFG